MSLLRQEHSKVTQDQRQANKRKESIADGSKGKCKICSYFTPVNVVLDLVRGKDVKYAEAVLKHTPKAACEPLLKLLNSAMANAENNHDMDVSKLYIAQCNATAGPILKRIRPRAQGRAFRINKRTSHISLVLKEREDD